MLVSSRKVRVSGLEPAKIYAYLSMLTLDLSQKIYPNSIPDLEERQE